jgi:hypothetical protein
VDDVQRPGETLRAGEASQSFHCTCVGNSLDEGDLTNSMASTIQQIEYFWHIPSVLKARVKQNKTQGCIWHPLYALRLNFMAVKGVP